MTDRYVVAPRIGVVDGADPDLGPDSEVDAVFLARFPDGPALVLRGASAVVFREATRVDGGGAPLLDRIARALGVSVEQLDAEALQDHLDDLTDEGLCVVVPEGEPT